MKITFDKDADAMYIEVSEAPFAKNRKMDDETIIDLDVNGKIIGVELLNASKRLAKEFLSEIEFKNLISVE